MPTEHSGIDFVAYDREGRVVLLAEAKSRRGTSEDWAARLRRNMLSHGILPWARYFLIATPERMYLWRQEPSNAAEAPPEFTIDAAKVFQPYFQKLHQEPSKIGPEEFDLLVLMWLTDIARSAEHSPQQDPSSAWLSELAGSLQQARIEMNPVQ
jgi:thioester reductase-like protein